MGKQEVLEPDLSLPENTGKGLEENISSLTRSRKVAGWEDILSGFLMTGMKTSSYDIGFGKHQYLKERGKPGGRIFDVNVTPLTFEEFLELNGIFVNAPTASDYSAIESSIWRTFIQKEKIHLCSVEYLFRGDSRRSP